MTSLADSPVAADEPYVFAGNPLDRASNMLRKDADRLAAAQQERDEPGVADLAAPAAAHER